jgi:F0F1-type ATP synthase membrane subunit b/b'
MIMAISIVHAISKRAFHTVRHVFVILSAWTLFLADAAASSEGHAPALWDLRYFWVNFILYVLLMYLLLRKVVASAWATRREKIERSVSAAQDELNAAERQLKAVEDLVNGLKADQSKVREEILDGARQEGIVLYRAAQERSVRVAAQAKELLKGEARSAEAYLRDQLVSQAVEMARSRFSSGQFSQRQDDYVSAAIGRAKRLVS